MFLTTITGSLVLVVITAAGILVAALPANASCEFHGSPQAGIVDCVRWADDETPGDQPGNGASIEQASHGAEPEDTTKSAPVCRDSGGAAVPCTITNGNGDQCYYRGTIGAAPAGSGGGSVYMCPPPDDEGAEPGDTGAEQTQPADPVTLTWRAVASMGLQAIDMRVAPKPLSENPDAMGLVGLPVWLWTDRSPTTWGPVTASATDGPVSVTATARVERVEWDMGDGTVVRCTTPGSPFDPEVHGVEDRSPDCGHVYERTSHRQPSGAYTVTATSYWVAEWSNDEGESGTIPFELTASEQIRIGEMHVLRTSRAS